MNISIKMVLAAWLLTISLASSSEAGKFGKLPVNSMQNKSNQSISKNLRSNSNNSFKNVAQKPKFNTAKTLNNSSSFKNLSPVKKMSPVQNMKPVNGGGLKIGTSPIKKFQPEVKPGYVFKPRTHSPLDVTKIPPLVPQQNKPLDPGIGNGKVTLDPSKIPPLFPQKPTLDPTKIPPLFPQKPVLDPTKIPPLFPGNGGNNPPIDPGPGNGNPPMDPDPPYCPPKCPPWCCPPGYWPHPVCLPPIYLCPPVCYHTCVTTVCPNVIVDQTVIVEQPVAEEAVEPMLQLLVGKPNSLEAEGLGDVAGSAAIEVGAIGLPTQVRSWADKMLVIDVPFVGLNGPTPAMLHLFDSQGKPLASIPVELIVPVATMPAEAAE